MTLTCYSAVFPPGHSKTLQSRDVFSARILQSGIVGFENRQDTERKTQVTNSHEWDVAERFLEQADESSFTELFRIFSPQLVAFFRRRGHETGVAEDLAQEVMLTVYRKAGQLRDHKSFRAWLFKVARNAASRHFAQRSRQVPTVDVTDMVEALPAMKGHPFAPAAEFQDWMKFLDNLERETMTLRFVEEWEYHEIAAAQAIPIGTVQWRVFNSKKKLAPHLSSRSETYRQAA
ncbi:MAG: hypothetical protein C5B51_08915 [Terriglobia bacterium]|nr:MAG: hypothetical protein C5B51_08915 [Terriglobia bacterium]